MDTLVTSINALIHAHVVGQISVIHLILMGAGTLFPVLLGMILPRKQTIKYGMLINKTLGLALLQKRIFKSMPTNILEGIVAAVQTTFQDVSFGVYIDSRKDITPEEKQKKIDEYLVIVKPVETPVKPE